MTRPRSTSRLTSISTSRLTSRSPKLSRGCHNYWLTMIVGMTFATIVFVGLSFTLHTWVVFVKEFNNKKVSQVYKYGSLDKCPVENPSPCGNDTVNVDICEIFAGAIVVTLSFELVYGIITALLTVSCPQRPSITGGFLLTNCYWSLVSCILFTLFTMHAVNNHRERLWSEFGDAFYCAVAAIVLPPCNLVLKYKYKRYVGIMFRDFVPKCTLRGVLCAILYMPIFCARRGPDGR